MQQRFMRVSHVKTEMRPKRGGSSQTDNFGFGL